MKGNLTRIWLIYLAILLNYTSFKCNKTNIDTFGKLKKLNQNLQHKNPVWD